mgnify:CR=1 FL=1|jgi:hypothetical protein
MTYDLKNVFYLDTELTMPTATSAGESNTVQLDLSSYIDPIARGRSKGTGLAIYKVHYSVSSSSEGGKPDVVTQAGSFRGGIIAGAGFGTQAGATLTGEASFPSPNNALAVMGFDYYGAKATIANASVPSPMSRSFLMPSEKVPYVVVRDNVCLMSTQLVAMSTAAYVNVRLECAQVTLDQATLNQLLRTQTV